MKSGLRISHRGGLHGRAIIKIKAHRGEISSGIFAHRRIFMANGEEDSDRRKGAYNLNLRRRADGPVRVSGTTIDGYRFLGVSEFPYNVVSYSGAVVDVAGLANGIYSITNGFSLRVEEGDSRLVQIIGFDPSRRIFNARRVNSGLVKYKLEAVADSYELRKVKPRAEIFR